MTVKCCYCHVELDTRLHTTYRRILGWERKSRTGSRRGGSDVVLREPETPTAFACEGCIGSMRDGCSPRQGALL